MNFGGVLFVSLVVGWLFPGRESIQEISLLRTFTGEKKDGKYICLRHCTDFKIDFSPKKMILEHFQGETIIDQTCIISLNKKSSC